MSFNDHAENSLDDDNDNDDEITGEDDLSWW